MRVRLAHLRTQGIDFVVFDANASSDLDSDRATLLHQLTVAARNVGLKIDKSALAFVKAGRLRYYGTNDLVRYLANHEVPCWTHTITI